MPSDSLSVEQCIRWLSKTRRSSGVHEHRLGGGHVVVDDLEVAVVGAGPTVGHVGVHRFGLRPGQHVQAAVGEGRLGDGEPHPDDGPGRLEGKVERVLVPGLAPRARRLEDELRQEDVDVGRDQLGCRVDHGDGVGEVGEDRVAVQIEDLGHAVLRMGDGDGGLVALRHDLGADLVGQRGVAQTCVTRSSIAAQMSPRRTPPRGRSPARSTTCAVRPSARRSSDRLRRRVGGRSPSARGQATGVTSLAMTAPRAMPARSTDGWGKRPSPRVDPSPK